MPELNREDVKEALKEVIREFLHEKEAQFGRFSLAWTGALLLGALVYLWFKAHGFDFKP